MTTKQDLRIIFKEKRNVLFKHGKIDEISSIICEKLISLIGFYKARHILTFYPKGAELDTRRLLDKNIFAVLEHSKECCIKSFQNIDTTGTNAIKENYIHQKTFWHNINFYLPLCKGNKMFACPYKPGDELLLSRFKIYEPTTKPVLDVKILDMVITPALCADKNFNRLGYGGGFYDRFFANPALRAKRVVIIPDDMLIEAIPANEYDKKCDIIVTEKRILEADEQI